MMVVVVVIILVAARLVSMMDIVLRLTIDILLLSVIALADIAPDGPLDSTNDPRPRRTCWACAPGFRTSRGPRPHHR
jgi:hypothetical protein